MVFFLTILIFDVQADISVLILICLEVTGNKVAKAIIHFFKLTVGYCKEELN